uniref:Non-specific serine/threonine protein kinase n=1 Tax=Timema monikensis TaxID=170555 RepID=A0A7R9EDR5_9NEOP|nr:unnamed protein product [Timema monikensis]
MALTRLVCFVVSLVKTKNFDTIVACAQMSRNKDIQAKERYETAYLKFNRDETVTKFQELTNRLPWDIFRRGLLSLSSSPEVFFSLRHNFVLSYATMCISHWFLGIGDRHLHNCLVSQKDARCVAIDFGHSFGTATQFLPVPELFPFRLTPHIVSMMQPLEQTGRVENRVVNTILSTPDRDLNLVPLVIGIYCESSTLDQAATKAGFLRESMIHVVRALRKNHSILLATMEVFVLEPSIDWLELARKQNKNIHASTSFRKVGEDSWFPRQKVSLARKKFEGANPAAITEEELQTGIMSSSVALKKILEVARGDAEHNIRAKLPDMNLTPEKQVDCLLDQATDYHLLGMSWDGWEPWVLTFLQSFVAPNTQQTNKEDHPFILHHLLPLVGRQGKGTTPTKEDDPFILHHLLPLVGRQGKGPAPTKPSYPVYGKSGLRYPHNSRATSGANN